MNNSDDLNSRAGQKIRRLRKCLGLSQNDLATQLDISYQQLQKYEAGKNNLNLSMLQKISGALGVKPEIFLDTEADVEPPMHGENLRLMHRLKTFEDPTVRKSLLRLLDALERDTNS